MKVGLVYVHLPTPKAIRGMGKEDVHNIYIYKQDIKWKLKNNCY